MCSHFVHSCLLIFQTGLQALTVNTAVRGASAPPWLEVVAAFLVSVMDMATRSKVTVTTWQASATALTTLKGRTASPAFLVTMETLGKNHLLFNSLSKQNQFNGINRNSAKEIFPQTGTTAHVTVSARAAPSCCPPLLPQPSPCLRLWDGGVAQKGKEDFLTVFGSYLSLRSLDLASPNSSAPL